jgi:hypothetical protein
MDNKQPLKDRKWYDYLIDLDLMGVLSLWLVIVVLLISSCNQEKTDADGYSERKPRVH